MKYLRMHKLQFFITSYNSLTKFHTEKVTPFQFTNFLTWYEIKT